MTDGEKVIKFITDYCSAPEGKHVGKPISLLPFQREFILAVYDNPSGTSRAFLSMARKNGKSTLVACLVLVHLVGPKARLNSQIISGARSREQAAIIYKLAEKMCNLNPTLKKLIKPIPSSKTLIGLPMNIEFKSISAEAKTAHGLSPVVAILDEVGQISGPQDAFVEAIETAQGAHDNPLLIAVSTQAAQDGDLFSQWIDKAATANNPRIVSHIYTAPVNCDIRDRAAWKAANPALGEFRLLQDIEDFADRAADLPSAENSFRWLFLNQRVNASSPLFSKSVWMACNAPAKPLTNVPVYAGLDLSSVNDLTSFEAIGQVDGVWQVESYFWLPGDTIREKAKTDRQPYDVWHDQGYLLAAPGKSVDYQYIATVLRRYCNEHDVRKIAFDRYNFKFLLPWLLEAGFSQPEIDTIFVEFGQGYLSMSPAIRELEGDMLNQRIAHGGHPVLTMCNANAIVTTDPAGNRKLDKSKAIGRIDGMVALVMAKGVAPMQDTVILDIDAMVA